jgi:hypothetical protein
MRYIYTLPLMDSPLEKIYGHLDALGVRLDPGILWNAIPFSFVVDWVVDVSGFLSSFARDNYPINVTLLDFCHSFKWVKEAEVECSYATDPTLVSSATRIAAQSPTSVGWIPVYRGTRASYSRVLATPSIHAAQVKAPKLRQAALAGSLLLAQTGLGKYNRYLSSLGRTIPTPRRR